ncbi:cyclophilin-like domain-containing protein [Piptocephalis cylindrospora]|uniref:Peptidyl-prolyl cis-trans isomerase n=1 Tax=Piptocephalis cylindrospora TaxID=1907219 RepID=A0A4P9Y5Z7_9FUNG|nr:cyclophilin-like domain-containing protein [Piptocephalis cylindrospora]|eukprot:RKP13250.1 cyclophilin-like domain-containing protein [Piptocephalis cylindrospora]
MSVLLETSLGDIVIDLYIKRAPETCLNFLKLCKVKYYNFSAFHRVQRDFTAQTGDPTCTGQGGECIRSLIDPKTPKYMPVENHPKLKHTHRGTVSMAAASPDQAGDGGKPVMGSQFFITLADDLNYLDGKGSIFGRVAEGLEILDLLNDVQVDGAYRPFVDVRIKHTIILDDPFPDPEGLVVPDASPLPTPAQLATVRIGEDESLEDPVDPEEAEKQRRSKEAGAHALTLEMIGDLPFAEVKPPENVLFVCKLNPITRDEDLELIFSRFGTILSCEVIRDQKTKESLGYAFVEFDKQEEAEEAYFKMDNVLIDDRRIHVDFSQSVSKLHANWASKGANAQGFAGLQGYERNRSYREVEREREDARNNTSEQVARCD